MRATTLATIAILAAGLAPQARAPESPSAGQGATPAVVRTLVVTGGHEYPTSFYTLFEQPGVAWDHAVSNEEAFRKDLRGRYDALVLYDMSSALSDTGKGNFRAFAESGGGIVVLHHAIVSYPDWSWYHDLVGGRYVDPGTASQPASTYLHDQDLDVRVAAPHPISTGVSLSRIHDEAYKRMVIATTNTVLLTTDHPASDRPLAWVSAYPSARVVYIQLGHGAEAHRDPGYRALVGNAIRWVSRR